MRTCASFGLLFILTSACSNDVFPPDQSDAGKTGDAQVGGGDGGNDAGIPPGCDASKLPTDDKCVVNDGEGVFVSSSKGSATGDGTKEHPLASLEAALISAKANGRRVYACAETYPEQVHLQDGVSVFGYFDCASWTVSTSHAKLAPPASPVASASTITKPTRIEAVDFVAPDFTDKSQSSIALIVNGSPALTITHATIHAGTGGQGVSGTTGIQLADSGSKNGTDSWKDGVCIGSACTFLLGQKTAQPAGGSNACVGETGHDPGPGGAGGNPGEYQSVFFISSYVWNVVSNQYTTAGYPTAPTTQTAQGGGVGVGGSSGAAGANGNSGTSGLDFGTVSAAGYTPSDGTTGAAGSPGQGGGGSGGYNGLPSDYPAGTNQNYYGWGEPGAAGGAGGCPGLPGQAGKGGGASIAIVALNSGFTLDTVTIESSKGGNGGVAGAPSTMTAGGSGGHSTGHVNGGGNGGAGGDAGLSGNGGGGPSIGITYDKTKPTLLASTVKQGAGGSGVLASPASANGLSVDTYQLGQ